MPNDSDIAAAKRALRERFSEARLALSDAAYRTASAAICRRILELPEVGRAATLSVYWPLLLRKEVDTRPLIAALCAQGRRVLLPVVAEFEAAPTLGHVEFTGEEHLIENAWGVLEPAGPPVPAREIELCIVPALGAGRNLHRIGYGRGFYDAFLRTCAVPAIVPVFGVCLIDEIPAEAHDAPVHRVVTEAETVGESSSPSRNTGTGDS